MANEKILVVEDEIIIAMDIRQRLESLGYQVVGPASCGAEALELAESENLNLVLMDIMLAGGMDGITLAKEIKRRHNIPVIFMSAYSDEKTLQRSKDVDPYGYIIKPYSSRELRVIIELGLNKFKQDRLSHRDDMNDTRNRIANVLMATLAEKDYTLEEHTRKTAELCNKVAARLGLREEQIENLALLAQVHDLGKLGIPDNILFKTGPLTSDEWRIMQQHSEAGYRIAAASSDLLPVASLILKHHERWDGTGYPWGLKGKEIPVECRILSVVDAYGAMTRERPYRKPMNKEDALAELIRYAGTQFDPEVVKVFLDII